MNSNKYRLFVLNTESNLHKRLALSHDLHRLVKISCLDIKTGKSFHQSADPMLSVEQELPNQQLRDIIKETHPSPHEDVAVEFKNWVHELCHTSKDPQAALFVCHNARFHKDILLKSMVNRIAYGKDGINLNWYFFDTLKAFRELYEEIGFELYLPYDRPYTLSNLYKHFKESNEPKPPVDMLWYLFEQQLLPKMPNEFSDTNWMENDFLIENQIIDRTQYLTKLDLFKPAIISRVVSWVNGTIDIKLRTSFEMITIAHLIAFGTESFKKKKKQKDIWVFILKEIELLFRRKGVTNDDTLLTLLGAVAGTTALEIKYHTMSESGKKNIFPAAPTSPVSYLPLKVSAEEAAKLHNILEFESKDDMITKYYHIKNKNEFIRQIEIEALSVENRLIFREKFLTLV